MSLVSERKREGRPLSSGSRLSNEETASSYFSRIIITMMASISAVVNLKAYAYTIALLKMSVIKFKLLSSSLLINPVFFKKV